jgi:hypothetical protein
MVYLSLFMKISRLVNYSAAVATIMIGAAAVAAPTDPESDSFIIPEKAPTACYVSLPDHKFCTAFPWDEGVYVTDAHCLVSNFNFKTNVPTVVDKSNIHLYCPYATNPSEPKLSMQHFRFVELSITESGISSAYNIKDFTDPDDMALILTSNFPTEIKPIRWATSDDEIRNLLKLDQCRTMGYSRGYYAEIPAHPSNEPLNSRHVLNIIDNGSFGDSGGPIVCKDSGGEDVVIGVTTSIVGHNPITLFRTWLSKVLSAPAS